MLALNVIKVNDYCQFRMENEKNHLNDKKNAFMYYIIQVVYARNLLYI